MSHLPNPTTTLTAAMLKQIRTELLAFARRALIAGTAPELDRPAPATLRQAFDEDAWRRSPLFRRVAPGLAGEAQQHELLTALLQGVWEYVGDPYADEAAHAARERIGHTWALLRLTVLAGDSQFMHTLTQGTLAHLLRTFPLRLHTLAGRDTGYRPLDLGRRRGEPLRWRLSAMSIFWLYGAYLVYTLSHDRILRRLALPAALSEQAAGLEARLLDAMRRRLRLARDQVATLLQEQAPRLTPGDFVLADGVLVALLESPEVTWEDLAPLVRASPISRVVRLPQLRLRATSDPVLRQGLRPGNISRSDPALLLLAGTDELAGVRQRMAQTLADACQAHTSAAIFEEAAVAMRWLADDTYQRIIPTRQAGEQDYRTGALLLTVYSMARQDETLENAARRSPGDFMLGLSTLLPLLFELAMQSGGPRHAARQAWQTPETHARLKELTDGHYV